MTWGRILLWVVLGASLLANAVVLGLILRFGAFSDGTAGQRSAWTSIPAEVRAEVRAELVANRQELRLLVSDLRQARAAMLEAATARPFDRAKVEAEQARVRSATEALQLRSQDVMLNAFEKASKTTP
jgi:uncharacterized membrane protein